MRKIILSIAIAAFVLTPTFAQEVEYIKLTDDSWEFMTSEEKFTPRGQKDFGVSFQVYNDSKQANANAKLRFFLILSYKTFDPKEIIPANGKLLIRSGEGEVFNFANDRNVLYSISTYYPTSGRPMGLYRHEETFGKRKYYINRGRYEISMDEMTQLGKDGVVKIRIETNMESIDIDLPAEEKFKIGKERYEGNRFAISIMKLFELSDRIFNPLEYF